MIAQLSRLDELAVVSGRPRFEEKLHVGRPNIGDRTALMNRIDGMLDRLWLTTNLGSDFSSVCLAKW